MILVVDDDPAVRDVVHMFLRREGYHVLVAADGEEALQLCRQHGHAIRLVITDVILPGLNGRELAERMKEILPRVGVMFMSAYVAEAGIRAIAEEGKAPFLATPFGKNKLLGLVRGLLEASAGSTGGESARSSG